MPLNTDGGITVVGHGFLLGEVINPWRGAINPYFYQYFLKKNHTFWRMAG